MSKLDGLPKPPAETPSCRRLRGFGATGPAKRHFGEASHRCPGSSESAIAEASFPQLRGRKVRVPARIRLPPSVQTARGKADCRYRRHAQEGDRPPRTLMAAKRTIDQKIPDRRQSRQSEPRFPGFAGESHAFRRGPACRHLPGRLKGLQVAAPAASSWKATVRRPLLAAKKTICQKIPDRRITRQSDSRFPGFSDDRHAFRRGTA